MSSFIRCPECGFCIGKYTEFINKAKDAIYEKEVFGPDSKYSSYSPDKMVFDPSITPSLEPLFEALNIKNRCCRMHSVTRTDFAQIYK
jgi:DNA-directed RNA polymerase subunit N (RpoN/RPB10)